LTSTANFTSNRKKETAWALVLLKPPAARLAHWIEIKNGVIKNYQVMAPTTWNVGPNDEQGKSGPIEAALTGIEIEDPHDPVEVGMVARSFDSCLVCTVHAHDGKTGEQLAKFKL
jgi:Ni,Fe-hydrogenase I large subunit